MNDEPSRAVRAALVGAVILPIVVAVVRALHNHWFPIGDDALLYIRARDVLTGHHPLLGSWTSASLIVGDNMNNPGPIHADLIAPFAHAFSPGPGAAIGVGTLNALAIVGASAAARHIGGWAMQRWVLLASAALAWTMGSELLIDIWQGHAMLLPFLVFLVLVVGIGCGRTRCIPWALAVASLLVQTHVSYSYAVALLGVVGALLWWFEARRPRTDHGESDGGVDWTRLSVVSLAVVAVLWAQPVWEQLFGPGRGNLGRLLQNSSGGDVTIGAEQGAQITAAVVALPPWWLRRGFDDTVPATRLTEGPSGDALHIPGLPNPALAVLALLVVIGILAALAVRARRTGRSVVATAAWIAATGTLGAVGCLAVVSVGRVGLAPHHVRWIWALAVFVDVVIVWALVDVLVVERARAVRRWLTPAIAAAIGVLVLANVPYEAHPQGPVADYWSMPALRRVFRELPVLEGQDPVLYDVSSLRVFEPYSSAVMMRLQDLGIEFRVSDEGMVRQLGPSRRADGSETVRLFQLEQADALTYAGPACRIALASALTVDEETRIDALAQELALDLASGALVVDADGLPADELTALDAVHGGDSALARRLVLDGTLQRWVDSGRAVVAADVLAGIGRRVDRTYALFADGLRSCPAHSP